MSRRVSRRAARTPHASRYADVFTPRLRIPCENFNRVRKSSNRRPHQACLPSCESSCVQQTQSSVVVVQPPSSGSSCAPACQPSCSSGCNQQVRAPSDDPEKYRSPSDDMTPTVGAAVLNLVPILMRYLMLWQLSVCPGLCSLVPAVVRTTAVCRCCSGEKG